MSADSAAGATQPAAKKAKAQPPTPALPENGTDTAPTGEISSPDLHALLQALQAVRVGDFSVRLPGERLGLMGKIADTFNDIVAANERMAQQIEQVGQAVGREGKTRQRVRLGLSSGAWGEIETAANGLIDDLLWPPPR